MDIRTNYYQMVMRKIKQAMDEQGFTQDRLADECCKRTGIAVSQTTVSKILRSGAGHGVSMIYLSAICQTLSLDLNEVLRLEPGPPAPCPSPPPNAMFRDIRDDSGNVTLIANPKHPAFGGYIDREFDLFYLPTVSTDKEMVTGTMRLSNENGAYCKVHIKLFHSKHPAKEYVGQMLISERMCACYCVVKSDRIGELVSFVFHYKYFTQSSLSIRIAVVSTVSAGTQHPTVHRMIICRPGMVSDDEKKAFIAAQLRMNSSAMLIPQHRFQRLREDDTLTALLQALEARNPVQESYYMIEENDVLHLRGFDRPDRYRLLSRLREQSVSHNYNKVGEKADELLFKYFKKLNAPEESA